jgi:hypothetical protein
MNKYLAWGGEGDPEVITATEIRKDWTQGHYSGYYAWSEFALIEFDGPRLVPVWIGGGKRIVSDDYIFQLCSITRVDNAEVIEEFVLRLDGRA